MFDNIFAAIEKWMRELLSGMVESNLSTMFTAVNQQTSEIAAQVGQTPQGWNSSIFSMIRNISDGIMMNVRFDELELMLVAMFEQKTFKGTIQTLTEVQQLVEEDAEMAVLVQQSIQKLQQLNEQQFKGLELEWYKPDEPNQKVERVADE